MANVLTNGWVSDEVWVSHSLSRLVLVSFIAEDLVMHRRWHLHVVCIF